MRNPAPNVVLRREHHTHCHSHFVDVPGTIMACGPGWRWGGGVKIPPGGLCYVNTTILCKVVSLEVRYVIYILQLPSWLYFKWDLSLGFMFSIIVILVHLRNI